MEQEAFVYIWKNLTNDNEYIGYHKGTQDDGYVCSSASDRFWNDFDDPAMQWKREIVFEGSQHECLEYEQSLLKEIDLRSDSYYNNARGSSVIFTDEVREKIRQHHLGGSSGMKGKTHSEETKEKQRKALLGRVFTQEHLEKLRKPNADSSKKRGPKSEEHKQAMREAQAKVPNVECPYCKVTMRATLAKRWHFENCKKK
jgi:hypothetical protein